MSHKTPPSIPDIKAAVAAHFGIATVDFSLTDNRRVVADARTMTVFLSSRADYSNAEIANALGYRGASHVSTVFNNAQKKFTEGTADFHTQAEAIAKKLRIDLL